MTWTDADRAKRQDRWRANPDYAERDRARRRANRLAKRLNDSPPGPVVPEGFAVRSVSTTVGADGETRAQSINAAPETASAETIAVMPEGQRLRRVSSLVGGDGKLRVQWILTDPIDRTREDWLAACLEVLAPLAGALDPLPTPGTADARRLTGYVIGDAHIGMLSWRPETGASYDVDEAERLMRRAVDELVAATPATDHALIINVGDLQHADSPSNATPEGGNRLDVDGRDQRVRRAVIRCVRYYIDRCLTKHRRVGVVNQPGNHDPYAAQWLGLALELAYEREPRVAIDTSPAEHRVHVFGRTMIGVTHKPRQGEDLGHIMAAKWPEDWGSTTYRTWICGHVHHGSRRRIDAREYPGVLVETFGTLAPGDAWHAAKGYSARRQMTAIVWDREWGEVGRHTVCAAQLAEGAP